MRRRRALALLAALIAVSQMWLWADDRPPIDGTDLPVVTHTEDRMTVEMPDGQRLELAIDSEPQFLDPTLVERVRATAKSASCDPYMERYAGYAPVDPASHATLGLPPLDSNCDGHPDRPWYIARQLDWHSVDNRLGAVKLTDVRATIIRVRTRGPHASVCTLFAAIDSDGEAVAGWVKERQGQVWGEALVGRHGAGVVSYRLFAPEEQPLSVRILEGGVPLVDGQLFERPVVLTVALEGASGSEIVDGTIDGIDYKIGTAYADEGSHEIEVTVIDGENRAEAAATFSIDLSAPVFDQIQPVEGALLGTPTVTVSGLVSVDAVTVTVAGEPAVLGSPFSGWRPFTSTPLALNEGTNFVALHAEDGAGRTTDQNHTLVVDSLPPVLAVTSPADGMVTGTPQLTVSGTAVDPHLTGVMVNGAAATVGGGSFSFDMTLAEGANAVMVVATDSLGHARQTSLTATLDSVPPVLTIFESGVAFADGLLLGRPAVITVVADDATAVDFAATIDGQPYLLGSPFVTPGAHVFAVTATDEAANSASATRSFTIDNDPPLIDDLSPIPGTVIGASTVGVAGRVSDDAVEVVVNGIAATFTGSGSNWIGWSIPALPLEQEGLNLLPLRAVDAAGNATEFDISYDRDTLDPEITLTAPVEGLVTRFANLTVAGAAADAHLERVTVNGTEVAAGADGSFSHAVVLAEGPNTVTVVAADVVFHESTAVRTVILDSAPPVISVSHNGQPLPEGFLSKTPVTPVVTAADDSEVTVAITLNGAPFTSGTAVSAEGSYILVATATDAAGNTAELEIAFRLDLTPPAISGLSLADGAVIANPSPMLSGACDDAVSVEVNGSPAVITAGTFSFAGLTLAEGANQVVVTAADAAGNQRTLTFSVTLDTAPPVITVTAPTEGDLVGAANVLVIGTAADPHLHEVTVAGRKAALAGSSFQTQVPLAQEGSNVITVTAVDRAGNSAELTVTVERDTTAPVLTVNEPGPSAVLGDGAVTVSGTVSDAHAATVTVDTRSLTPGPDGAFQTVLQLPEGSHAVKVEAVDAAGNRAAVTRNLTVDLSAPELRITAPTAGAVLDTATVTVTGTVADANGTEKVTVNGVEAALDGSGGFSLADLALAEGANTIIARAWDRAGNTGTRSIEVAVDTVPPRVTATVPADGATGVPRTARPRVKFSEPVDAATLAGSIRLLHEGAVLPVTLSAVGSGAEVDVAPTGGLVDDAEHVLEVGTGVRDRAGHALEAAVTATFTTRDGTPPLPPILDTVSSPACFSSLIVTGLAESGARVRATGDVQPASTTAAADGAFSLTLEPTVGEGAVEIEVTAEDAAGNTSQAAYLVVELDCTQPRVTTSEWDGDTAITVRYSEALDETTVAAGQSVTLDGPVGPVTFTVGVTGSTVTLELVEAPPVEQLPLRLEMTSDITDLGGNAAIPYSQLFAAPGTATFVAGEVFSDADSLELPGARIVLIEDGGPVLGDPPMVTADGRGRFQLPVTGSPVTVRVEADGYLPSWRRTVPIPGAATILFDVRLSPRSAARPVSGATQLEAGAARLTIDGASVPPDGLDVTLTPISAQGLPDLLPLGWRPLGAAHVGLPDGFAFDPPAVLEFRTDVPPGAVIASYDAAIHAWVAAAFGGTVDVVDAATFALLIPDSDPTAPGAPVAGSVLPSAASADPGVLTATLRLDPPVILPMEIALAEVAAEPAAIVPSGHPVEARLDEVLHVVDGGVLVTPPTAVDLVLYRQPDDSLTATFGLGASETARRIALDEGVKNISIRSLPAEVRTQDLVGPDGASLLSPDGVGLEVPAGALDRVIGARIAAQPLDALPLTLPPGLEAVAAADLDLGTSVLSVPATLSFPGAGEADGQYLLLSPVEADGASHWRLVGLGALEADRIVCGPDQLDGLPAPGVRRTGLYVLARSTGDAWALLGGTVIDIDGDPATATCLVTATGGLVQLTVGDGVYALAAPAGNVDLEAENLVSRDSGSLTTGVEGGVLTSGLDIALEIVRPRILATSPVDGADRVSAATPITVDFSEPLALDRNNLWGITVEAVSSVSQTQDGTLELSSSGTRLTWTPDKNFPPATQILVTVDGNLEDLQGYRLEGGDFTFQFGVERYVGNENVDESKIRLFVPGRDSSQPERAVVEGEEGAVPADIWMFIEDLDHDAPVTTFQATGLGAFATTLAPFDSATRTGVAVGDRLRLHILDSENPDDELYVVELKPWLTIDGLGAFFNIDGGEFITTEGIGVSAPWGAFPATGTVRATLLDHSQVLPQSSWPSFAEARAAARLELTVEAARTLQLIIPGDPPIDANTTMHACMRIEVAGAPHPMLVRTATWDNERQAYVTAPVEEAAAQNAAEALVKAAATGNPDPLLPGIRRTMDLVVLEPKRLPGQKSASAGLHGRLLVTKGTVEGDVQVKAMFLDSAADVVYANTHFAPSDAALVAFDSGGAQKLVAATIAGYAVMGINEILTPDGGATVPLRPDDDFVLKVTDPDTGYTHSERGYPAPDSGDWLDIPPSDAPGYSDRRARIVGGSPFTIFSFEAAVGRTPLTHLIEVTKATAQDKLVCAIPNGAIPNNRFVRMINLRTGDVAPSVAQENPASLSLNANVGDPVILVLEPLLSSGQQEVQIRFDRSLKGLVNPSMVELVPLNGGATNAVDVVVDGDVLRITPDPVWETGKRYELRLTKELFAALGSPLVEGQFVGLPLKVSTVASVKPVIPDATVAEAALENNVLLVAARDQGLLIYDISNPASPAHVTTVQTAGGVAGVASDGFGNVVTLEGRAGQHVVLRLWALEDLMAGGGVTHIGEQPLSPPLTNVGPGDLELEVFVDAIDFTAADPGEYDITVVPNETGGWASLTVGESLFTANHRVELIDGVTGSILWRDFAPAGGPLTIPNAKNVPLAQPLKVRAHADTLVWAHAAAGPVIGAKLTFGGSGASGFSLGAVGQNADLLNWIRGAGAGAACRVLGSEDSVYLGRLAATPRQGIDNVLLAASRYEGIWGFRQTGSPELSPDWIECVRYASQGSDLTDIASARVVFDEGGTEVNHDIVAVVGHRRLEIFEMGSNGDLNRFSSGVDLGWNPFRVAIDPVDRLILVRDNASRLAVYALTRPGASPQMVADMVLPDGAGLGPLVLDPDLGLAITGTSPVQYKPPRLELVSDTDGNGIPEIVEYLQPLGAPAVPPTADGQRPPYLAWVRARIVGVPKDQVTVNVRVEGLAPGGGVLPDRPVPFLQSSRIITLRRAENLPHDDPGRNVFVSDQPILLIADERARTEYWEHINQDLRTKLTDEDTANARYALCRNCDRDLGGGVVLPWSDDGAPGAPIELAAAARLRVTFDADSAIGWIKQMLEAGMAPAAEVASLPWMPSPPIGRDPGIEARAAMLPEVELATGALTLGRTDLVLPAPGMDVVLGREYSSAGIRYGLFGWGWELAGLDRLRPNPDGTVDLYASSGDRFVFGKRSNGHPAPDTTSSIPDANTLTAWAYPGELKRKADGTWFLLTPDGGYTEFSSDGYPIVVRDRYRENKNSGSELRLLWHADGTLAQLVQVNGKATTDINPRTTIFRYGAEDTELGDGQSPPGLVTSAEDPTGRTYLFAYDGFGRMVKAGIKNVALDSDETPGTIVESYVPALATVGSPAPGVLEEAGQLDLVRDAEETLLLDADWVDGRVTRVTRGENGENGPAIVTSIVDDSPTEWKITEGVAPAGVSTVTKISLGKEGEGWTSTVTVGLGVDATTSTTILDRDGRVRDVVEPGGVTTTTDYWPGTRRYTFLPKTVTTTPGTVGEEASATALVTKYEYVNGEVSRIERPGPVAPIVTSIIRNSASREIVTEAPDGSHTTSVLDELGRVKEQISSTGAISRLTYDDVAHGSGELETSEVISDVGTTMTIIGRNALGQAESSMTHQIPADGGQPPDRSTTTASNVLGWTLKTESGDTVTRTTYDEAGRIESIVSGGEAEASRTTTVPCYTSAGMISNITRTQGAVTESNSMTYDDAGRLWTSSKSDFTTTYLYDSAGRTETRTESWTEDDTGEAFNMTTGYGYELGTGRLLKTTTPGGKVWTNHFDRLGRQVGRTDPAGVRETLVLGADGRLSERRLVTGGGNEPEPEPELLWAWEEFGYDDLGRQRTHTVHRFPVTPEPDLSQPKALTTTTGYFEEPGPKLGLVEWIEDSLRRRTSFDYDDAGREVARELPDGTRVETTYYPDGKVHTRTVRFDGDEPWSLTTTTIYDDQGRVHEVIDPGGRTTTTLYDDLGRKQSVVAPDSVPVDGGEEGADRLTSWSYGDLGRVVTETRPDGAQITRTYDESGNLVAYEDNDGNTTTYRYYKNGRLKAIVYPDGTERSFTYYDDGEMREITRADGTVVTFDIDENTGRLKTVDADDHQPGGTVGFDYDPVGHLILADDRDVVLGFTWDSVGNQLSESLALPLLGFNERTVSRIFDDGNRPVSLGMPDGLPALVRGYDGGDRLASLTVNSEELWSADYDGGRLTRIDRSNGLKTTFSYDGEGRPTEVATGVPGAEGAVAAPLHRLAFGWTDASLRRTKERQDTRRLIERFHYDGVGHLESDLEQNLPAVAGVDEDLAASLPGLEPQRVEEWWTVNRVDELTTRRRVDEGAQADYQPQHDADGLHQVVRSANFGYDWDDNGNLAARRLMEGGATVATDTFSHDWRDRLVGVEHGSTNTTLVVDPLGRLVAKVNSTSDGDVGRVYLHDGDQVAAEYVQEAGGSNWQLERRYLWGRWIDDLAVEQTDTDGDGALDLTLWPITDLLGSVQLLTDGGGRIVERIEYATDGTPRFFAEDTTPPTATRVAWTGDGLRPTGDTVEEGVFEIGFDEWLGEGSVEAASATLTPDGGEAVELSVTLDPDRRGVTLVGATVEAGMSYALHLDGPSDRSGNVMWALDLTFSVGDAAVYETLLDAAPPTVLAVIDAADGLYVLMDEPVVAVDGVELADAISVVRGASAVPGSTEHLGGQLFKWTPDEGAAWYPQQRYQITQVRLQDVGPSASTVVGLPSSFTHIATFDDQTLVAYSEPDQGERVAQSRYGLTSLFQGRAWNEELRLYYFRARWYGSEMASFLERDPPGYTLMQNRYAGFDFSLPNKADPSGKYAIDFHYYAIYFLARKALSDEQRAYHIAWASQHVDDYVDTQPVSIEPDHLIFHFLDVTGSMGTVSGRENSALSSVVKAAIGSGSDSRVGATLHTFADSYSHRGFTWKIGAEVNKLDSFFPEATVLHVGHLMTRLNVDIPSEHPDIAATAAIESFKILKQYGIFQGIFRDPQEYSDEGMAARMYGLFVSIKGNQKERVEQWKGVISSEFGRVQNYDPSSSILGSRFSQAAKEQLELIESLMKVPLSYRNNTVED